MHVFQSRPPCREAAPADDEKELLGFSAIGVEKRDNLLPFSDRSPIAYKNTSDAAIALRLCTNRLFFNHAPRLLMTFLRYRIRNLWAYWSHVMTSMSHATLGRPWPSQVTPLLRVHAPAASVHPCTSPSVRLNAAKRHSLHASLL
jgi:hypothetical protein